jgi:hypothetical protein
MSKVERLYKLVAKGIRCMVMEIEDEKIAKLR